MSPILSPYALIMISAAVICTSIVVYVWPRRQSNSETVPLILLLMGIAEWIVTALLGLVDPNLSHKIVWAKFEYIGVVSVPLMVLVYVLHHSGSNQQLGLKQLVWLALIPVTTLILAWTNEFHGLIWAEYIPYRENGLVFSDKIYGLGFWVYWVYSYLVLLGATVLSIRMSLASSKIFRWQSIVIVIGILMPWVGNLLYVLRINPFGNLDLTPLAFSITGIALAIGMFQWQLFDIKPIAQAAAIAGMADGLLILDNQGRILDVNPAAQTILGLNLQELVGKKMEQIVTGWLPLAKRTERANEKNMELKFKSNIENRDYEISDSPFYEKPGVLGGMIVFLHDTTNQKRLEEKLREMERKHAETLLQQSENKFATLYQNMSVGVIYRGANGNVTDMNPAAERILGVKLAQISDVSSTHTNLKTIREDGSDFPVKEYPSMVALKTGKPVRNQLMGVYFPDEKDYHWIIVNAVPQFEPGEDKPFLVFVTFDDITERKRAEVKLRKQLERSNTIRAIDAVIKSSFDLRVTLNVFLEKVATQLEIDAVVVLLFSKNTMMLEHAASRGFRSDIIRSARLRLGEDYAGRVVLEQKTIHIPNLAHTKSRLADELTKAGETFTTYIGVPLSAKGETVGVLELFHHAPLPSEKEWLDFLGTLADQAAIAINNIQLFEELQSSNFELTMAYEATIEGWSRALDLRDKEAEGHTQRVVSLTLELARRMGVHEDDLIHIRRGALLHDIGKLGVSDNILLKPGGYTDEEWEIVHQHPVFAYEMLKSIAYLKPALDIPQYHHEKWDGTGYPDGLSEEQIPLAARIFAVVNVWDTLISDRPHRPAWPKEKAISYIQEQSGSYFDPKVVEAFIKLIDEK